MFQSSFVFYTHVHMYICKSKLLQRLLSFLAGYHIIQWLNIIRGNRLRTKKQRGRRLCQFRFEILERSDIEADIVLRRQHGPLISTVQRTNVQVKRFEPSLVAGDDEYVGGGCLKSTLAAAEKRSACT